MVRTVYPTVPLRRRLPRLTTWLIVAAVLIIVIGIVSPQQVPVAIYKLSLISLAAVGSYWIDRALFPYARPDGYLVRDWRCGACIGSHRVDHPIADGYEIPFMVATIRRTVIAAAVILAVALGL
ncbi:putative holin [Achromobacter pulmonis]|uniref:putative holin n=1 Tax=Achromobacter pulmonis TaxID=1389932 RepID=UPI001F1E92F7|nr:putative holin [Achromobacter pulmonis]MCF7770470.1 putative holin [Achromobacter pulmonis]